MRFFENNKNANIHCRNILISLDYIVFQQKKFLIRGEKKLCMS